MWARSEGLKSNGVSHLVFGTPSRNSPSRLELLRGLLLATQTGAPPTDTALPPRGVSPAATKKRGQRARLHSRASCFSFFFFLFFFLLLGIFNFFRYPSYMFRLHLAAAPS